MNKFFFVIFIILLTLISCENKEKNSTKKNKISKKKNTITIEKFSFVESKKGESYWTLTSNKAIIDNLNKIITLEKVKIIYRKKYIIVSNKGRYFMDKKIAELYDSVKISDNQTYFITDRLKFFSLQNKIETHTGVNVINKNFTLHAKDMIGFIDRNKFILSGGVKSILR